MVLLEILDYRAGFGKDASHKSVVRILQEVRVDPDVGNEPMQNV